jgi:hypothetical protein
MVLATHTLVGERHPSSVRFFQMLHAELVAIEDAVLAADLALSRINAGVLRLGTPVSVLRDLNAAKIKVAAAAVTIRATRQREGR